MFARCNADTTVPTAEWADTCVDVEMVFEDELGGSTLWVDAHNPATDGTAPCGEDCVLGAGRDICFCSECVSSAFSDDAGVCEQRRQISHSELVVVSAAGARTVKIAATGVPTSACRTGVSGLMPAPGAAVPQRGAAVAAAGGLSDAHQPVKIDECKQQNTEHARSSRVDERKQKNRAHARSSRIRKKKKLNSMEQHKAELREECARLRGILQGLEQERKKLKAQVGVDLFLC
jgi:hypothetical protein